jgi:hypothetical protein
MNARMKYRSLLQVCTYATIDRNKENAKKGELATRVFFLLTCYFLCRKTGLNHASKSVNKRQL